MSVHAWLWPDRVIGKRESRRLREEHNALVNSHVALLASIKRFFAADDEDQKHHAMVEMEEAIATAEDTSCQ